MPAGGSRIGVLGGETAAEDAVCEAGGQPVRLDPPHAIPPGGVALRREWHADHAEVSCQAAGLDALLVDAEGSAEGLVGLLLAALRLDLPAVFVPGDNGPLDAAVYAMGFASPGGDPAAVAVEMARNGVPRPTELVDGFSLANALRAGLAFGGGPELLVHLAAVAREAGEVGFSQMIRVLAPESPMLAGSLTSQDLLALLGDDLHDVRTVAGTMLKEGLPEPPEERPAEKRRLRFVTGKASGVEAVVVAPPGVEEVAGACRVFGSEGEAVEAVAKGRMGDDDLLVLTGCGPIGGPGLLRLDALGEALGAAGLNTPVITDGLPPEEPEDGTVWVSLFTPEAADDGVIGRFADGDFLRFDLTRGRIRTGVPAGVLDYREPFLGTEPPWFGYAARYARSALAALEGAGFD